ncbi:MAG: SGNH/GDSL hydrolase family protein [Oscillospiraceae bacterium]|nr:SGNH/GDSL hydrolase family protein [Oscillospiraceae bacterium]
MKILFQGDSITDAGRDRNDIHDMGGGYPKFTKDILQKQITNAEFINLGISGDRAESLMARWDSDCIAYSPDILTILIGINDTWHHADSRNWMLDSYFESCYRDILTKTRKNTNAKIIIMEQFLLSVPDKNFFREDLDPKIQITRTLAREFADIFIPLDGIFAASSVKYPPTHWADDGVHPTEYGAKIIADYLSKAIIEAAASI